MIFMGVPESIGRRTLAVLLFLFPLTVLGQAKESHLPYPLDLKHDAKLAQARNKPIVFLFSIEACSYCEVIRQNYLLPLSKSASSPVLREIKIGDRRSLIDFDGKKTDHAEFAKRYNARWAPTVILVDHSGKTLADPLVGGDTSGLYGGMLDKALHEAEAKISRPR